MKRPGTWLPLISAIVAFSHGLTAHADLTNFDAFGNMEYTQTANNTVPTGPPLNFFASRLFYNTSGDVTSGFYENVGSQLSSNYSPQAGNYALAQTGFITPAQLSSYLAMGSIDVFVTGGNLNGQTGTAALPSPLFTSAVPYLTGNSYNQLQGLNAATADTVTFNNFAAVTGSNESDIFVTITRVSDNSVAYQSGLLSNAASSISLAANTLAAGTAYNLEVDFSSRLNGTGSFHGVDTPFVAGYDTRTEIGFTTAGVVPEPSSLVLACMGLGSAGLIAARRRRARASG